MTTQSTETTTGPPTNVSETRSTDDDSTTTSQEGESSTDSTTETFDRAYVEKIRGEAAQHRTDLRKLQAEVKKQREAAMTDAEKQVSEAEQRGRAAAANEYGARYVRATFDALAARRNSEVNTDDIVEYVDMSKFLDEDGEVDRTALQKAVDRLVPEAVAGPPSQDGGSRTTSAPTDMNAIIRAQAKGGRRKP